MKTPNTQNPSTVCPFDFEGHAVRIIVRNDEPWFVATDVARALDYRDAWNMSRYLDADEKGTLNQSTPHGPQCLSLISESGLYAAILRSRKPSARRFSKWVTAEVLPSIRKTGSYRAQTERPARPALPGLDPQALLAGQRFIVKFTYPDDKGPGVAYQAIPKDACVFSPNDLYNLLWYVKNEMTLETVIAVQSACVARMLKGK